MVSTRDPEVEAAKRSEQRNLTAKAGYSRTSDPAVIIVSTLSTSPTVGSRGRLTAGFARLQAPLNLSVRPQKLGALGKGLA